MNYVDSVVNYLTRHVVQSVCIEAGHIYVDEVPKECHITSLSIGAELSDKLAKVDIEVRRVLYVDDYNPDKWTLDLGKYRERGTKLGFTVDHTITESSMAAEAKVAMEYLRSRRSVRRDENILYLTGTNIRLSGNNGRSYSCELIESTLWRWKITLCDFAITILPPDFSNQQKKSLKILRRLGFEKPPCASIYTDGNYAIYGTS